MHELTSATAPVGGKAAKAPAAPAPHAPQTYTKKHPLVTDLVGNVTLSQPKSAKDVRQIVFRLPEDSVDYQAGDALGVWPRNGDRLVDEWLSLTRLDGEAEVDVAGHGPMPLRQALTDRFEIAHISPDLLRFVQQRSGDTELAALIRPENKAALADWSWGRQSVDLLAASPVAAEVDEWLTVLKPLQPRLYSISCSPRQTRRRFT